MSSSDRTQISSRGCIEFYFRVQFQYIQLREMRKNNKIVLRKTRTTRVSRLNAREIPVETRRGVSA